MIQPQSGRKQEEDAKADYYSVGIALWEPNNIYYSHIQPSECLWPPTSYKICMCTYQKQIAGRRFFTNLDSAPDCLRRALKVRTIPSGDFGIAGIHECPFFSFLNPTRLKMPFRDMPLTNFRNATIVKVFVIDKETLTTKYKTMDIPWHSC